MKQLVLEKIVVSGFPPVNKRCLWIKGDTFYFWFKGAWRSINSEIDINEEYIDEKVSETVSQELSVVLGDAPEEYDTLKEIADYIGHHTDEANEIQEDIINNKSDIIQLNQKIDNISTSAGTWNEVV